MDTCLGTYEFYKSMFFLKRNCYEYLWSYLFRLCMSPEAHRIITFIGDGLRFKIMDFKTLALLYYHPHDRFHFNDKEITCLFRSALSRNHAISNCWYPANDVFDFTTLRESELLFLCGMDMNELLNYAYCVRPLEDEKKNHLSIPRKKTKSCAMQKRKERG